MLYSALLHLALPFVVLRLLWQGVRNRQYLERWWERFGAVARSADGAAVIWIHAVSVGEVIASDPLIRRLRTAYPGSGILVTTSTPTGADMVGSRVEGEVMHAYFPYDLPWAVNRFLDRVQPSLVVVMETEIWPNLFALCRRRGIPLVMVNARISPHSFKGYLRVSQLTGEALAAVTFIAAQTAQDRERFLKLGASPDRVAVMGNLKFDIRVSRSVSEQGQALRRSIPGNRPVWVAASTHAGEETIVLDAYRRVLQSFPDCLLVLAPRHPEHFDAAAAECLAAGLTVVRRSRSPAPNPDCNVFLLDSLGELLPYYACADVAFVGGSLVPAGGHNLLEPASLGVALVTGPYTFNFTEIVGMLDSAGALIVAKNAGELAFRVGDLLADANARHAMGEGARRVFEGNKGAAERVVQLLVGLRRANAAATERR
jgi:3-deoxy-D-manno-octulosonic-acid transferase